MYQVMPLVVVIAVLTVVRPYSWVIWRQAWGKGIQCLLWEGKRRESELSAPEFEEPVGAAPQGWGGAGLRDGEMALSPAKMGNMFIFTEVPLSSHMLELQKRKKKNRLQPVPKTRFPLSCCMLFFFCKEKSNKRKQGWPLLTSFCFFDKLSKRFIVLKSRVYLGKNRNCAFSCLYNQPD